MIASVTVLWLSACAWQDVRRREIANWLTVPPLLLVAAWRLLSGDWAAAALLAAVLVASDLPQPWRWVLATGAAAALFPFGVQQGVEIALLGIFAAWAAWEAGAFGAADAKLLMALLMLFPSLALVAWLAAANAALGLLGLFTRRKTLPLAVAITAGAILFLVTSEQ